MNKNKTIYLYTDGSCQGNQSKNNKGGYGAYLKCGKYQKEISGSATNTTNNIMEMTAVIKGLQAIKDKTYSVLVFSDSAYIINCINQKWYVNWRKNGWKNSAKQEVLNKELWQDLLSEIENFKDIKFIKVKGHMDSSKESEIKKWYNKLPSDVKSTITFDEYLEHIKGNSIADNLAVTGANKGDI